MQTKTIDKLENLKGYEWEERGLKLTREEKVFLELLEDNYVYIARNNDSSLSLFNDEPRQASEDWYISIDECEDDDYGILLLRQTFPFITWESGKAWSKAELIELEVVD